MGSVISTVIVVGFLEIAGLGLQLGKTAQDIGLVVVVAGAVDNLISLQQQRQDLVVVAEFEEDIALAVEKMYALARPKILRQLFIFLDKGAGLGDVANIGIGLGTIG